MVLTSLSDAPLFVPFSHTLFISGVYIVFHECFECEKYLLGIINEDQTNCIEQDLFKESTPGRFFFFC